MGGQRLCQSLGRRAEHSFESIQLLSYFLPCSSTLVLHLLLLNHFLFTHCLPWPPSSSSSPARAPRMDAWTDEGPEDCSPGGKGPLWSFLLRSLINPRAREHRPASPGLAHGPGRRKGTLPRPRLTHCGIHHPLSRISLSCSNLFFLREPLPHVTCLKLLSQSPLPRLLQPSQTGESLWGFVGFFHLKHFSMTLTSYRTNLQGCFNYRFGGQDSAPISTLPFIPM